MNDIIARKIALSDREHFYAQSAMQVAYKRWKLGSSLDLFELANALNTAAALGVKAARSKPSPSAA